MIRGKMTQAELAELMGVNNKTISRYELNESVPDGMFLIELHKLFKADPAWILLGDDAGDEHQGVAGVQGNELLPDEHQLMMAYRQASEDTKRYLIGTAVMAVLPQPKPTKK